MTTPLLKLINEKQSHYQRTAEGPSKSAVNELSQPPPAAIYIYTSFCVSSRLNALLHSHVFLSIVSMLSAMLKGVNSEIRKYAARNTILKTFKKKSQSMA